MTAIEFESQLQQRIGQVVFGANALVRNLSVALIAGGHVLLEGVPGVGKTLLAKTLAQALGGHFRRVQCTADLMPSDITGIHVYRQNKGEFELLPGPIFGNVVLVDEINRTGPKTQSALLEAMEERQVSIDRKRYSLPDDFFLIASQNPHEFEGTYPLPESQLDRFLMKLDVPYPEAAVEAQILRTYDQPMGGHSSLADQATRQSSLADQATRQSSLADQATRQMIGALGSRLVTPLDSGALAGARTNVKAVQVSDAVYDYAVRLARASREDARVALGLSTRGSLALMRCARVLAALNARQFVLPDDLKALLAQVLGHRLVLKPEASLDGASADQVVADLLNQVPAPRGANQTAAQDAMAQGVGS